MLKMKMMTIQFQHPIEKSHDLKKSCDFSNRKCDNYNVDVNSLSQWFLAKNLV